VSFEDTMSKYHNYLEQAMESYQGQDLQRKTIHNILLDKFPELGACRQNIVPAALAI